MYYNFVNKEYANVRGILLVLKRKHIDTFSWNIDYTFQIVEGANSNPEVRRMFSKASEASSHFSSCIACTPMLYISIRVRPGNGTLFPPHDISRNPVIITNKIFGDSIFITWEYTGNKIKFVKLVLI